MDERLFVVAVEALCVRHVHFAFAAQVFARGLTALWHDLSTCWVWRPLMGRLVRGRSVVGCMRECVRRYWLCVFVQSVCEMVAVVVQRRTVRDETDARGCSAFRGNCRTT
ncbi:hypothetical protein TGCOUG_359720 [Toxoplasma gondii COUG]|uniref:Uncharacterized protein n=1 Tax=Toxoplasma gondii COUG TaxID=1074873 RepID=A0A2G8XLN3_TOXGO|nr:hypothetical protein TGCOUG_359720 [Toxoplasma gondii COUG]